MQEPPRVPRPATAPLAFRILGFFAAIIAGALLWSMLDPGVTPVLNEATNATSVSAAETSIDRTGTAWTLALFAIPFLAGIRLVAAAVREGGPPR